jgi:hypothetical protein
MNELTPHQTRPQEAEEAESRPVIALPGEEAAAPAAAAPRPIAAPPGAPLARPTVPPPGGEEAPGWHSGKKITGLWSTNERRNSWIGVQGLGWKKLANNSDSAVVALTMLAAHARLTGGNVDIKEDAEQITEIYAW